jgi:hypothetical protein
VIKGEFDKGLLTKIMKKKTSLQAKMCEELYLAIKLSPVRAWKSTYTSCNKVPSPLKAPTRMYAILLFIFIPKE